MIFPGVLVNFQVFFSLFLKYEFQVVLNINMQTQGGHGTGKTGNLVLTFSRQGKHGEFCSDTGKNLLTWKIFGL